MRRPIGVAFALACACASPAPREHAPAASVVGPQLHPVEIRAPVGMGGLRSGGVRPDGTPEMIACATCHDGGAGALATRNPAGPAVHAIALVHGSTTCLSCHDRDQRDALRLADGRTVGFAQVGLLCGQCHGPQARDYEHGSHGGMMGYWDRTRGPQTKNHCVVCHAPHAPAYARVRPAPAPLDAPAPHEEAT